MQNILAEREDLVLFLFSEKSMVGHAGMHINVHKPVTGRQLIIAVVDCSTGQDVQNTGNDKITISTFMLKETINTFFLLYDSYSFAFFSFIF